MSSTKLAAESKKSPKRPATMYVGNPFAQTVLQDGPQGLGHSGFEVSLNYVAGLPDPNIVSNSTLKLWFKALLKRDDTTKEKALSEFVQYVSSGQHTEELKDDIVLITWVQLYPKVSLAESKAVRSLAHQLQTALISTLQKSYVKYLKDTIPVLLSGVYDLDSSVANSTIKSISQAFNNDQKKVNNLWVIFQHEILNFADQALNKETVDTLSDERFVSRNEQEFKYTRLVNATVSMLNHLVQVGCKLSLEKMEKNIDEYHKLFLYENLWHYLRVNSSPNDQKIYKSLLNLINAVVNLNPNLFTEKAWKLMSKRLLKSLTFVQKIDMGNATSHVPYTSMILPIMSTLNILNAKHPEFFQFDKSHKQRLIDLFKVGSLNSDPSYYTKLSQLITSASAVFTTEDFAVLEKIVREDFNREVIKNSKLRAGAEFIVQSLIAYFEVASHFGKLDQTSQIIDDVVAIEAPVSKQLVAPLAKFTPQDIITHKLEEWCIKDSGNISTLLAVAAQTSTSLESTLDATADDLASRGADDEEGKTFIKHPAFKIYDFVIKNNMTDYTSQVEQFLDELPSFITPLIIDTPITILRDYSLSALYTQDLFVEIFDSFLIRFEMIGSKKLLLSKLDTFAHSEELLAHSEELQNALSEQTTSYNFESDELFKAHLITKDSALSLWELAKEQGKINEYRDFFIKNNSSDQELSKAVFRETTFLDDLLWATPLSSELHAAVEKLMSYDDIKAKYFTLLKSRVKSSGSSVDVVERVISVLASNSSLSKELLTEDLESSLEEAYGVSVDSRLSIGNPLETNIYLVKTEDGAFQFDQLLKVIRYASFLSDLKIDLPREVVVQLSVISEVADDYEFLSNRSQSSLPDVTSLHTIKEQFISSFSSDSYTSLLTQIMTQDYSSLSALTTTKPITSFYQTRLLKLILNQHEPTIQSLELDKYVRSQLRSQSALELLRFCTVCSTFKHLLTDHERLKNQIGSELIGMRPNEILTTGLAKMTVLLNFMEVGEMPLQPQRFNMVINELNKWLDSDAAYEPEFGKLRIQFLKLLWSWNSGEFENEQLLELSTRVLQDATGLVSLGEGDGLLELKYWCLKLYLVLKKRDILEKDVAKDILESYVNDTSADVNQAVVIYHDLVGRFLDTLNTKRFKEYEEQLFKKYAALKGNLTLKRPLLKILKQLILDRQQDLVVEYELSKEADQSQFKIPQNLLDMILSHTPESFDEDEPLVEYLWSWILVLLNFKDITLRLRSLYIQQLQNENDELISRFLNFVSMVVTDEEDKDVIGDHSVFVNYDFTQDFADISDEVKVLSTHIYYTILVSIGSLAANWFNNIKDRGFKGRLEQFTAKYISPSLIKNKLANFESKMSRLTKDHENLSLKINKLTNEVKASYLIDESYLEVVFKIPANYPLSNVEVSGPQRVGVKENRWKAWLLACQRIVSLQNGEISESLEFFLKNVVFHFKGFEECAICYSILHQDNTLPSKTCTTCKNKFHAACLFKWFKSSGANTCPLCRSTINLN